jgi:hypothetical protein
MAQVHFKKTVTITLTEDEASRLMAVLGSIACGGDERVDCLRDVHDALEGADIPYRYQFKTDKSLNRLELRPSVRDGYMDNETDPPSA